MLQANPQHAVAKRWDYHLQTHVQEHWESSASLLLAISYFPHDHLQKLTSEIKTQLVLQQMPPRSNQVFHVCWCGWCNSRDSCKINHRSESTPLCLNKFSFVTGLTHLSLHTANASAPLCCQVCTSLEFITALRLQTLQIHDVVPGSPLAWPPQSPPALHNSSISFFFPLIITFASILLFLILLFLPFPLKPYTFPSLTNLNVTASFPSILVYVLEMCFRDLIWENTHPNLCNISTLMECGSPFNPNASPSRTVN